MVITDAAGKTLTLTPNEAGNFFYERAIATPYKAKVIGPSGQANEMTAAQVTGDCNECHTSTGAHGAPGRILAPQ